MSGAWQMDWYNGWSPSERLASVPVQREAIRTGQIARPAACSVCGTTHGADPKNPVWLHDENYAQPLDAYHVCRTCHRALHDRFAHPARWHDLLAQHSTGSRWFEALTMDPGSLRQPFEITYPNGLPRR